MVSIGDRARQQSVASSRDASSWKITSNRLVISSLSTEFGTTDCLVEVFVRGDVTMIDAHQPAAIGKTPANSAFLDKVSKPSPDVRIFGVRRIRCASPDLL
jgi:hypothetical protein